MSSVPGLESFNYGKEVLLLFREDVGSAVARGMDVLIPEKKEHHVKCAAREIRNDIMNHPPYDGSTSTGSVFKSVPDTLISLVSGITEGIE